MRNTWYLQTGIPEHLEIILELLIQTHVENIVFIKSEILVFHIMKLWIDDASANDQSNCKGELYHDDHCAKRESFDKGSASRFEYLVGAKDESAKAG